ncbi:PIR Superfamily Protein [Plasmodium malariae]|uniref:PIR Superfamily Protein n=1 Tax=Plasmodium malariae TaxID=5858 RepID=A0A1A8X559_PLAMA|nr:PIR Superfamily Protein [Plasmodium malariae]
MEMDKILEESYPYSIYKELNDEVKNANDGKYCSEFENVKQDYKDESVKLCKKVSKILDFVFKKSTQNEFKDYCTHYKYWVYQEVRNLFNENTSVSDIEDVIKKFYKLQLDLFNDHNRNDCSYRFDYKTLEGLNYNIEEKSLYDYFRNFNTIKSIETCSKCTNGEYKEYLKSTGDTYNNLKEYCCLSEDWDCSHYFFSCKDEFDPSKLLSSLGSEEIGNCDGLKTITAVFNDKISDSEAFSSDFLKSLNYGACYRPNNGKFTSGDRAHPFCNLYTAPVQLSSSVTIVRINEPQGNGDRSPPGNSNSMKGEDQEQVKQAKRVPPKEVTDETNENEGGSGRYGELKKKASPMKDASDNFRWKIAATGQLKCSSKNKKEAELAMCDFMEELIEGGYAKKIEDTEKYTLDIKNGWTTEELKVFRERIRKRSAYESNILNNIFFRISTGVTLFTPFGSRLHRRRKRKQRYRFDFTDLSTRNRPRRFLKRTYRHSDRRRFNVVNIEDELHSSNDLRNIN